MQIGSKFTIGVHIITAIDYFKDMDRVNSEFLRGSSGAELSRRLDEITLYDVYKAVGSVDADEGLFHFHEQPNPESPVGRNIHKVLDRHLAEAQRALEDSLKTTTLADISSDTKQAVDHESK